MPQLDTKALSLEVAGTLNRALTPLLERIATIEARLSPLSDVRDRVVAVETKCLAYPAGPDQAAEQRLLSALERLSTLEYALRRTADHETMIADLKARLAAAEAVAAQYAELSGLARDLIDRVSAIEVKSAAPNVSEPLLTGLAGRVQALEGLPTPVSAEDVAGLRDRVTVLETKAANIDARAAEPNPLAPVVDRAERAVAELAKDLGAIRERVAVVEVLKAVPGPAGEDGADGQDGKDGVDGMGFDELQAVQDGDRTIRLKFVKGDRVKEAGAFVIPAQIGRGVFVEGTTYERGDVVTLGGSQWHANEMTTTRPGEGLKAWTLVVKRGRDGRDGKDAASALPVVSVGARS